VDNDMLTGKPARTVFSGTGWVSGAKLGIKSQAKSGRSQPNMQSDTVLDLSDEGTFDFDQFVETAKLSACQCHWVQVEVVKNKLPSEIYQSMRIAPIAKSSNGNVRVWFNEICNNQETTCDGLAIKRADECNSPLSS
jgi:hypothetical protein